MYRTCQVAFLHGTETDNHDFIQALHVGLHRHLHIGARSQRLGFVTSIGELELLTFGITHRKVSVNVSDATNIGSDDFNRDTDQGFSILVHYITFDRLRLLNFGRHAVGIAVSASAVTGTNNDATKPQAK